MLRKQTRKQPPPPPKIWRFFSRLFLHLVVDFKIGSWVNPHLLRNPGHNFTGLCPSLTSRASVSPYAQKHRDRAGDYYNRHGSVGCCTVSSILPSLKPSCPPLASWQDSGVYHIYIYMCIHIGIYKSSEFADRLSARDYKAVASSGEACLRSISGKCLGLEFSCNYENAFQARSATSPLYHSNICQISCH